jgi:plasmid stabilization system protein ParE
MLSIRQRRVAAARRAHGRVHSVFEELSDELRGPFERDGLARRRLLRGGHDVARPEG